MKRLNMPVAGKIRIPCAPSRWKLCVTSLLILLALPYSRAESRDTWFMHEWEPDFRVLLHDRFEPQSHARRQVITCLLDVADLQFRRVDAAAASAGSAEPDDASTTRIYQARYEISVEVFAGNRQVSSRYERFTMETADYRSTGARAGSRWHHFELELGAGEYGWWVEFQDLNSRKRKQLKGELKVGDESEESWRLSGIWLLMDADTLNPDPHRSRPVAEHRISDEHRDLSAYYEVLCGENEKLSLHSRILDHRDRVRHERRIARLYPRGHSKNLLQIPLDELGSGDFVLELSLKSADSLRAAANRAVEVRRQEFSVRWHALPLTATDLDLAVEQLRYVLEASRMREMKNAPRGQKRLLFERFWDDVDPSPETEYNELMQEYYRRAEFADRRFSWSRFAGWRSDRGRIYMLHGDPSRVERFSGDFERPAWERWYYEEEGLEYLFVDWQGFGDYELQIDRNLRL